MTAQMFKFEKSQKDITRDVLTNTIKMLTARKLIKQENMDKKIEEVTKRFSDEMLYKIPVDKFLTNDDKEYIIKILPQKISAVSKASGVYDFLNRFKNNPKIIIVKEINKKASNQIKNDYVKAEVFYESELMTNLINNEIISKHEILTEEEVTVFFDTYNCKKRNMPKIFVTEPIARYYGMKVGDIVRIERFSETSGVFNSYRLCVRGH